MHSCREEHTQRLWLNSNKRDSIEIIKKIKWIKSSHHPRETEDELPWCLTCMGTGLITITYKIHLITKPKLTKSILTWLHWLYAKQYAKDYTGRPKTRLKDTINKDAAQLYATNWITIGRDRECWHRQLMIYKINKVISKTII